MGIRDEIRRMSPEDLSKALIVYLGGGRYLEALRNAGIPAYHYLVTTLNSRIFVPGPFFNQADAVILEIDNQDRNAILASVSNPKIFSLTEIEPSEILMPITYS